MQELWKYRWNNEKSALVSHVHKKRVVFCWHRRSRRGLRMLNSSGISKGICAIFYLHTQELRQTGSACPLQPSYFSEISHNIMNISSIWCHSLSNCILPPPTTTTFATTNTDVVAVVAAIIVKVNVNALAGCWDNNLYYIVSHFCFPSLLTYIFLYFTFTLWERERERAVTSLNTYCFSPPHSYF